MKSALQFKIGLIVGRFQPIHKGHIYLIQKALAVADLPARLARAMAKRAGRQGKIIIAVGSSNVINEDNPLPFQTRVKMLRKVITEESLRDKVLKIVPSPDHPSDDVWFDLLYEKTGHFDIKFGRHNDTTNIAIEKAGFRVLKIPYLKRDLYQGIYIRRLFKKGGNWQTQVPPYLVDFIRKEFSERLV